jgi:hypothetical protein
MGEHEVVEELVPWFDGGDLSPGERERVERHISTCADCRGLLEQARLQRDHLARHSMADTLAHVDPVLLTEFAEHPARLDAQTREWIEGKLEECAACQEAYASLLAVNAALDRRAAPAPAPAARAWAWLAGSVLRPAPALAYLLLLAVVAPALILSDRRVGAPATLAPIVVVPDTIVMLLETRLVAADLTGKLRFTVGLTRSGEKIWERAVENREFELRDGRAVLPVVLRTGALQSGREHEISIRAVLPGDPLDGQPLFRRRLIVEESS